MACAPHPWRTRPVMRPRPPPARGPPPPAPPAAGPPRPARPLGIGGQVRVQGLDDRLETGLDCLRRVWDIVSGLDDKLNTVPILAESLDVAPDARQMTLRLRKGVIFHTGREMT